MSSELFDALALLEKERGLPVDYMVDRISKAIVTACKNSYGNEEVRVEVDEEKGTFEVFMQKEVVEEVFEPDKEIQLDEARKINPNVEPWDMIEVHLNTKEFGRIAAQTARNIIRQGIRDGERGLLLQEFQSKHQELVTATVERIDPKSGAATLRLGKAEAVLPKGEQVGLDNLKEGDHIKVYVADVRESEKGPRAMISRTHPDLVKRLFETEVPEIFDGTVEIKAVSREAGNRTKLAVLSHNPEVDAVGACIGARGARVNAIVEELGGEKIDIVEYSENPAEFIASALSPATVLSVKVTDPDSKACRVTVPDGQLSLAIGNKGQNARLAARLTGWKIDIKPESGFYGEEPEDNDGIELLPKALEAEQSREEATEPQPQETAQETEPQEESVQELQPEEAQEQ